ncbi:MAG: ATP-dependent zinc metalloprotease FtsH [Oscillospiraceae bacterium]|nr:ATP-dependent zinc metalloprotease FtsH [Oscillospiraceae bacterium]
MKQNPKKARDIGFYALFLVILLATIWTMTSQPDVSPVVLDSDIDTLFNNEQVKEVAAVGDELTLELYEPFNDSYTVKKELSSIEIFRLKYEDLIKEQKDEGIIKDYAFNPPATTPLWISYVLPYVGIILVLGIFWYIMMKTAAKGGGAGSAMKFGKARTRLGQDEKKKVTFNDVAGAEEEKEELQEIVGFLKSPASYTLMGARIPKGVLLVGPPGTGKTLIAKAVAGEAGVQFLSISGSDFVELYVGVGASRVRDLFEQAKKIAPAIIFIDEIDAVGRQRGSGLGGGHDEREQTLNQLLVEMDGFGNNDGVIVMAATNRSDILDSALLRPGRFDRTVYVGLPDKRGREAILKVHSRGKPLGDDVDLNGIARGTPGFSGADLENLLNEAAILAVRRNKRFISQAEIEESILKVMAGPEKKSRIMSDKAKKLTAFHEAGHAVTSHFLEKKNPVQYITIIPRGPSGGMTVYRPDEDTENYQSRSEMFANIVSSLGGRIAEKLMLDDVSTGASSDIQNATRIARAMVTVYGFSDKLGPISFEDAGHSIFIGRDFGTTKSYSEETAALIDEEVKRIFDEAGEKCEQVLTEHRELLIKVAEYLLVNESMEGEDFAFLCEHGYVAEKKKTTETDDLKVEGVQSDDESFSIKEEAFNNNDSEKTLNSDDKL